MRRRDFITLLGGAAAAWPVAAHAQQRDRMRRIGVFMPGVADDPEYQARNAAFLQGLGELGWIVGRNVRIEYRWGAGDAERYRTIAAELVALAPDVVLALGFSTVSALAEGEPHRADRVRDRHRSGRRWPSRQPGAARRQHHRLHLVRVRLEREVAGAAQGDRAARDARGGHAGCRHRLPGRAVRRIQSVASSLGVELRPVDMRDAGEIERAVVAFAREPNGGLMAMSNAAVIRHRELIVALAARHRLPAVYAYRSPRRQRRPDLLRP